MLLNSSWMLETQGAQKPRPSVALLKGGGTRAEVFETCSPWPETLLM